MKKLLIMVFLCYSLTLSATTYYVSTSGSNSNNGLTQTTAWQTLQWAESHATAAGDIIALKKGDIFLETNVIEITHGGSGGKIITWDGSQWGAGANAIVRSNVDGGNAPVWNAFVHIAACQYVTLQNITFDGNAKNRFGIVVGGDHSTYGPTRQNNEAYITVQNCEILNFGRGSFYCLALTAQTWNNSMSNITFKGNIVNGCGAEAVGSYCGRSDEGSPPATPAQNTNLYIGYNTISNFGRSGNLGEGIQINNKTVNAIVEHNIITDGPSGTGVGMSIEHNEPNAGYFPTGLIVRYNKITMTKQNTWCLLMQQGEAVTADIYGNVFINENTSNGTSSSGGGGFVVYVNYTRPYNGAAINLYNNTFYSKSGNCIYSECNTNGALRLKNNILYNQATSGSNACLLDYFGYATHSNNLYYRSAGASELKVQYSSSYYYTAANVQGWEATAKAADPLFMNVGSDFRTLNGSPAIDAGIAVTGLTTDIDGNVVSNPPNIGAYENAGGTAAALVYTSSVVENATPNILAMTYNLNLAILAPATSAFSVKVNTVTRTVNAVTVSGTKVLLTLASPVVNGDGVTVAYTAPVTNPIQSSTGGKAASFTAQSVVNNISAVLLPGYVSSAVQNATPNILEIIYNLSLATVVPAPSAFNVKVNSVARTVNAVAVSGTKVQLTLASAVKFGEIVTVSYTKPATNPLQTATGGIAANISDQTTTNNLVNPTKDITPVTITMNIPYKNVHSILNILLAYSATPSTALSPQVIRISNYYGRLMIEKLIVTGATSVQIPLNLSRGYYYVKVIAAGNEMASKRIRVY